MPLLLIAAFLAHGAAGEAVQAANVNPPYAALGASTRPYAVFTEHARPYARLTSS